MKINMFLVVGISVALASSLRADPASSSEQELARDTAHLKSHEENLGRMQASRTQDQTHMDQKQEELRGGNAKLSDDHDQQRHDAEHLKSVDGQITAGRNQQTLDRKSYDDAVKKYGRDDPASTTAKQTLQESRQALVPIRKDRKSLMTNMQKGRRQAHNDKTVLSIQKREVASDARYLAQKDAHIEKMEKVIVGDHATMAQDLEKSAPTVQTPISPLADSK